MYNNLRGTGIALVTPFLADGKIDEGSLKKIIEFQIKNKTDYLVVLGTTGESATLSKEEKKHIQEFVIAQVKGRVPIVLGVGGNNTQEIVGNLKSLSFKGVDAILSVSPYYNKPTQEGIYQHYRVLAKNCPVPIILYNVPGRTGSNISAETTLRLASEVKNIIGIKEASGNISQIMEIIQNKPKDFLVISGDDALTLALIALGADGVISVVANAFTKDFSQMVKSALHGDFAKAKKIHYQLLEIIDLLFVDGSPAGVKAALEILGLCKANVRLPLVNVRSQTHQRLHDLITRYPKS